MNMDYQMLTAVVVSICAVIAAAWAVVSIRSWLGRPKFEIGFHGGGTNKRIIHGQNNIAVEFRNKKPRPATDVKAYVMFPCGFTFPTLGPGVSAKTTTPGGKFPEQPFIFNPNPVLLFREEALVLLAQVDVPGQARGGKPFEIHALIVCAEGTSKSRKLYLELPKS